MPWSLQQRDGRWDVVRDDGNVEGSHDARTDAIKHQRALILNEARVASMYAELDTIEPVVEPEAEPAVTLREPGELVKIEIGKENEALTASVLAQMERMSERQAQTDQALIAALSQIGAREPVVNVPIAVEPTPITVEAPAVTVAAPVVNVEAPAVEVHPPNIVLPDPAPVRKQITFERNVEGRVTGATVEE